MPFVAFNDQVHLKLLPATQALEARLRRGAIVVVLECRMVGHVTMRALAWQIAQFLWVLVSLLLVGLALGTAMASQGEEFGAIAALETWLVKLLVIIILELTIARL